MPKDFPVKFRGCAALKAEINDTLVAEGTIDEAKYEARQAVLDALYAWGEALGEYCEAGDETEDTPQ